MSASFARTAAFWGGIDVVVSNAGCAPEGQLDTGQGQAMLRYSMELNCLAHARVACSAVEVMAAQDRGGCLCFNAGQSDNSSPGFGPYAVAKSALLALMRQYAVDLGPRKIRSNAVNANRVRTQLLGQAALDFRAKGARTERRRVPPGELAVARSDCGPCRGCVRVSYRGVFDDGVCHHGRRRQCGRVSAMRSNPGRMIRNQNLSVSSQRAPSNGGKYRHTPLAQRNAPRCWPTDTRTFELLVNL